MATNITPLKIRRGRDGYEKRGWSQSPFHHQSLLRLTSFPHKIGRAHFNAPAQSQRILPRLRSNHFLPMGLLYVNLFLPSLLFPHPSLSFASIMAVLLPIPSRSFPPRFPSSVHSPFFPLTYSQALLLLHPQSSSSLPSLPFRIP